jgi:hypothetical protein
MSALEQSTSRQKDRRSFAKNLAMPLLVFVFALAPSLLSNGNIDTAQAGVKQKAKLAIKGGRVVVKEAGKLGKELSKQKGLVGKLGKSVEKGAKTGDRDLGRLDKGINKTSKAIKDTGKRAAQRFDKTKLGRQLEKQGQKDVMKAKRAAQKFDKTKLGQELEKEGMKAKRAGQKFSKSKVGRELDKIGKSKWGKAAKKGVKEGVQVASPF